MSKGSKWQMRRRLIAPAFSLDILNDFLIVFNDQAKILVDILKENLRGKQPTELKEFDIIPYVSNCTLDILCGINLNFFKYKSYKSSTYKLLRNCYGDKH